jgi:hypothetical protein
MRKQIRITIFDQEQYDSEWPPTDAKKCIEWFTKKLESIEAEYRETAKIEITSFNSYGDSRYSRIVIYYDRFETDREIEIREAEELRHQERRKERELKKLAMLQEKYRP